MLTQIVIAGSGGQGIQFAGQLLARAAAHQGLKATYVPSYGAERRGGTSFCSVVISDQDIYAALFTTADILLALDQRGRNQYATPMKASGLILVNEDLAAAMAPGECAKTLGLAASTLADQVCPGGALNLVMLGALAGSTGVVKPEILAAELKAVSSKKPALLESNLNALEQGLAWGRQHSA